jgi:dihydroflavonol-4-reductase
MRVVVTGGTGFIGRSVVRQLVERGHAVSAISRDPRRAAALAEFGATTVAGDLSSTSAIAEAMRSATAVIHLAGDYRVGIPARERPAMLDANLGVTERVMDAATLAGLERIVYTSTANVLGNTGGQILTERHRRDIAQGFLSYYDETKYLAHRLAEERIAGGAPVLIVMPGMVYGPGDHSSAGEQLERAYRGTAAIVFFPGLGGSFVHVEDLAGGIVAALERGRTGESYILAGENLRFLDAMAIAARIGGSRPPRFRLPDAAHRLTALTPAVVARRLGFPDDLAEVVRAARGVTYWASSAKAATELDYHPRDLASGLRAWFESVRDLG